MLNRLLAWLFAIKPEKAAEEIVSTVTGPILENTHGNFSARERKSKPLIIFLTRECSKDSGRSAKSLQMPDIWAPTMIPTGSVAMYNDKDIPERSDSPGGGSHRGGKWGGETGTEILIHFAEIHTGRATARPVCFEEEIAVVTEAGGEPHRLRGSHHCSFRYL